MLTVGSRSDGKRKMLDVEAPGVGEGTREPAGKSWTAMCRKQAVRPARRRFEGFVDAVLASLELLFTISIA